MKSALINFTGGVQAGHYRDAQSYLHVALDHVDVAHAHDPGWGETGFPEQVQNAAVAHAFAVEHEQRSIGKVTRVILEEYAGQIDLVAVNEVAPCELLTDALRRDSTYGMFRGTIEWASQDELLLTHSKAGSSRVRVFSRSDPVEIPRGEVGADLVFECTGRFVTREAAGGHLTGGATVVVLSAPPKDDIPIIVIGVNDEDVREREPVVSNASCTTNCLAPVVKALDDAYQVSADAVRSPWSSMVLAGNLMTVPMDGMTQLKVTAFHDNEMGFASRLAELGILRGPP